MRVWLVAAGILVVLGGSAAVVMLGLMGDESTAAALAPKDSLGYVHATLDPALDQKRALANLAKRLPEDAQEELEKSFPKALDSFLGGANLDFEKDIKPWLGGEAAFFVSGDLAKTPEGAALLETKDAEKSLEVARRVATEEGGEPEDATHREVEYSVLPESGGPNEPKTAYGIVGDFLVIGTVDGVKGAIDASEEGGIDGNESYSELVGSLTPDRLLTYWVDTPAIFETMTKDIPAEQREQFASSPLFSAQQPQAGALFATDESVVFEGVSSKSEENPGLFQSVPADPEFLGSLPEDTWFSFVFPSLGKNLEPVLESTPDFEQAEQAFTDATGLKLREDVLSWMGDAGLFVAGENVQQLGGALIVESSDPAKAKTFLDRVVNTGLEQGVAVRPTTAGGQQGYELADASIPGAVTAVAGERLIIAVDAPDVAEEDSAVAGALGEGGRLGDTEAFSRATDSLGEGYAPIFFVDVGGVTRVIKSTFGETSTPPEFAEVEPYLKRLSHVVAGSRDDGDRIMQRLVIGTTEP